MTENTQQNDIFQTLSALREKYTDSDDLQRIDAEYARIGKLLKAKGLAENEAVKELVAVCRADIIYARMKLASDKSLVGNEKAQRELWFLIESREWFVKIVSQDFDGELASLEVELKAELDR